MNEKEKPKRKRNNMRNEIEPQTRKAAAPAIPADSSAGNTRRR